MSNTTKIEELKEKEPIDKGLEKVSGGSGGGAIYGSEKVSISGDVTVVNNMAGISGGSIPCSGNVIIGDCNVTFVNNTIGIGNSGGAVSCPGNVSIGDCNVTFNNNTTGMGAGVIYNK